MKADLLIQERSRLTKEKDLYTTTVVRMWNVLPEKTEGPKNFAFKKAVEKWLVKNHYEYKENKEKNSQR